MTVIAARGLGMKWAFYVAKFLMIISLVAYAIWAGNMAAIVFPNPVDDRYTTFIYWRHAIYMIALAPPIGWATYLEFNKSTGFVFMLSLLLSLVVLATMIVFYVFFVFDIVDCGNVDHCTGDGDGLFGIDPAFWVTLVTTALQGLLIIPLCLIGILVRRAVQRTNMYNYYEARTGGIINIDKASVYNQPTSVTQPIGARFRGNSSTVVVKNNKSSVIEKKNATTTTTPLTTKQQRSSTESLFDIESVNLIFGDTHEDDSLITILRDREKIFSIALKIEQSCNNFLSFVPFLNNDDNNNNKGTRDPSDVDSRIHDL